MKCIAVLKIYDYKKMSYKNQIHYLVSVSLSEIQAKRGFHCISFVEEEKSRIRETLNLSMCAD